jgi:exopolysaccharide biosynthesis polyprenyl glycosylphosphotransferase
VGARGTVPFGEAEIRDGAYPTESSSGLTITVEHAMRWIPRLEPYKLVLAVGDYACILAGYFAAIAGLAGLAHRPDAWRLLQEWEATAVFALFGVVWMLILQHHGLYKLRAFGSRLRQAVVLLRAAFYALIGFAAISFFIRPPYWLDSRVLTAAIFAATVLLLLLWRLLAFPMLWRSLLQWARLRYSTAIAGTGALGLLVAERLLLGDAHPWRLVGFLSDTLPRGTPVLNGYRVLGSYEEALEAPVEHIICADPKLSPERVLQLAERWAQQRKSVTIATELYPALLPEWLTDEIAGLSVVGFAGLESRRMFIWLKRAMDVVIAAAALVLLSPLLLLISIAIAVDSPGPVLYRQRRVGRHGRQFWMYKFRTMHNSAAARQQWRHFIRERILSNRPLGKVVPERQLTRVGRWLRRWSLDELPQLWNVLRGEMSLVGPRPLLPEEAEFLPPFITRWRHQIPPGCTGLWQISDRSHTFAQMLLLDVYYVQNLTPWLDLYVLLRTLPYMLRGRNN